MSIACSGRGADMTWEEEIEHIKRAQHGDIAARNALVERHYGYIWMMTRKALVANKCVEEYLGIAVEVFMSAISGWKPEFKTKLTTYAGKHITNRVRRAVDEDRVIHVPRTPCEKPEYVAAQSRARAICTGSREDDEKMCRVVDRRQPIESLIRVEEYSQRRKTLANSMRVLSPIEQYVLVEYLVNDKTFKEIGMSLGFSSRGERARQIYNEGRQRLLDSITFD